MVYWKGVCIGEMLNPMVDNFTMFGKWHPRNDVRELADFIKEIEDNEETYICLGNALSGLIATVAELPDSYIDIVCRGSYSDIESVIHTNEHYESLFFGKKK